jgi:YfiH family protein
MLQRRIAGNGVVYYTSSALEAIGVGQAFSTRLGGVSPRPFDSLNLGGTSDSTDNIAENFRRLLEAAGCAGKLIRRTSQVHGCDAIWVNAGSGSVQLPSADAILSDDPRCISCVRIADCVPILVASEDGRVVAAVHAGWRGVIAQVVPAAVAALKSRCETGMGFRAAIGPSIGVERFEVGVEVAERFGDLFGRNAPIHKASDLGHKPHIDLRHAIFLQLRDCGLTTDHIETSDRCTFRDEEEFFSHRRDNGVTGRMAAIIACRE